MAPSAHVGDWDYTDAEWVAISAAIKKVRSDPLSDTERLIVSKMLQTVL
jgi:hypothetical protein